MLENLLNLVRQHSPELLQNTSIPPERKDEATKVAASSIAEGFQSVLSSGGVKSVFQFFQSPSVDKSDSPVYNEINSRFTNNFSSQFGLSGAQASGLAASFLPSILSQFVAKTNDPNDKSFDLQDMFNQFSGGKTSGVNIGSMFGKIKAGLDRDGDGDVDLNDLKAMFSGTGGGLMEKIRSVFK